LTNLKVKNFEGSRFPLQDGRWSDRDRTKKFKRSTDCSVLDVVKEKQKKLAWGSETARGEIRRKNRRSSQMRGLVPDFDGG